MRFTILEVRGYGLEVIVIVIVIVIVFVILLAPVLVFVIVFVIVVHFLTDEFSVGLKCNVLSRQSQRVVFAGMTCRVLRFYAS